ncbi:MAG TPA: HEAT repeat domain-containing protein [Pyrinomonadaceae bacterium]|nr:HEAT repeat domain-containing protein [Pyrinomonadaceae bacterium]
MASNALPIIEEFLRAGTPQQRKNALTALTVIGDAACVRALAASALGDEDAGVRAHALDELASLGEEKNAAVGVFEDELQSGDKAKSVRAYAVLGRLQSVGAYKTAVRPKRSRRLLLAASLYKHLYLVKNWDFRLRSWKAGLLGSLAGGLIFVPLTVLMYLRLDEQHFAVYDSLPFSTERIVFYMIGVLLIIMGGAVMAMVASQRATPINLHISDIAAVFVEMVAATLLGFIGILGFYAVLNALLPKLPIVKNLLTIGYMVLTGVMAGVTRAASAMAFGIYVNRKMNWLAEVLAGTVAGFVVIAAAITISFGSGAMSADEARVIPMAALPFAMGCASAFASIDNASPPAKAPHGLSGFLLQILFFPAVIALGATVGFLMLKMTS